MFYMFGKHHVPCTFIVVTPSQTQLNLPVLLKPRHLPNILKTTFLVTHVPVSLYVYPIANSFYSLGPSDYIDKTSLHHPLFQPSYQTSFLIICVSNQSGRRKGCREETVKVVLLVGKSQCVFTTFDKGDPRT